MQLWTKLDIKQGYLQIPMLNECGQFFSVWCKIGVFWSSILKVLLFSWAESMLTIRVRSFQRGSMGLYRSKVCKVTTCQSWRMILSSWSRTRAARILVWLWPNGRLFFKPQTLIGCNFATLWSTETHSTSLERSRFDC